MVDSKILRKERMHADEMIAASRQEYVKYYLSHPIRLDHHAIICRLRRNFLPLVAINPNASCTIRILPTPKPYPKDFDRSKTLVSPTSLGVLERYRQAPRRECDQERGSILLLLPAYIRRHSAPKDRPESHP